jgi:catechol 2,3-dioxygenase-like lactoylglutathione lyase family enzyme
MGPCAIRRPVRFLNFHHAQLGIPAASESRAREFYGSVLGLAEIPKPAHLAVRGGLWFQAGEQELHLGVEPEHRPGVRSHLALRVDGLDELRARLEGLGIETLDDLPLPGYRRFYARDPFGNRLEFLEPETRTR